MHEGDWLTAHQTEMDNELCVLSLKKRKERNLKMSTCFCCLFLTEVLLGTLIINK